MSDVLIGTVVEFKKGRGKLLLDSRDVVSFRLAPDVEEPLRKFFRYRMVGHYSSANVFEIEKVDRASFLKADYDVLAEHGITMSPGEIETVLAATGCPNLDAFVKLFRAPEEEEKAAAVLDQVVGGDRARALARNFHLLYHNTNLQMLRDLLGDTFDEPDLLKIYDFLRYRAARRELTVAGLLRNDPYHLVHVPDLSKGREGAYQVAERLATSFGMSAELTKSVAANVSMYLWREAERGHTYCERKKVVGFLLGRMKGAFKDYKDADQYLSAVLPKPGVPNVWPSSSFAWEYKLLEVPCVYLSGVYHSERIAAESLTMILKTPPVTDVDPAELLNTVRKVADVPLNHEQEEFVRAVARNKVVILDGEAGTGKTAVLAALVRGYKLLTNEDVAVLAPTGIAARRLGEHAGVDLDWTIHRFAEIDRGAKDLAMKELVVPLEDVNRPGKQVQKWNLSLVVVDEMSMTDVVAFARLLNRCLPGARLVLAGDSGQLPPVGPGPVFQEILRLAEGVSGLERVTLKTVYRQKQAGMLDLARSVRRGKFEVPPAGVEIVEATPEETHARAVQVATELWRKHGPGAVLVLTAKNIGDRRRQAETAARLLNEDLKKQLNPLPPLLGTDFSAGDPVMAVVNDYEQNGNGHRAPRSTIFNGMQGKVIGVYEADDVERPCLEVDFGGTRALYYPEEAGRYLTLAYACTVHKAQGSGADWVVLALDRVGSWGRDWLYTAVTRARKGLVLVGPRNIWEEIASREPVACRCTLGDRIRSLLVDKEVFRPAARSAAYAPEIVPYVAAGQEGT
ncbi:AAA family ATPase [Moorellaceae bacterium AZ2]